MMTKPTTVGSNVICPLIRVGSLESRDISQRDTEAMRQLHREPFLIATKPLLQAAK